MRTIANKRITTNFSLHEIIEGQLPPEGVAMNWKNIHEFRQEEWERHVGFIQSLRNSINGEFKAKNGGREIGLAVTSGWRCLEWEHFRKRSGKSQHCVGVAFDVQPTQCRPALAVEIMDHFHKIFNRRERGHFGGYARSFPEYSNSELKKIGFLHFDFRGMVARWEY